MGLGLVLPVYAGAMLLMISLVPVFKGTEQYWFERHTCKLLFLSH